MVRTLGPEIDHSAPGALKAEKLPHLNTVIRLGDDKTAGMYTFREVRDLGAAGERSRLDAITNRLKPDDAINIQFTSGTTGFPKGATLTHKSILNNGYFTGQAQRLTERDRVCIPVPLYHCFDMVLGNLACISVGAAMIYPGDAFDPRYALETVATERCTSLYGVPTMFIAELGHPDFDTFDLGSLRTGIMAGAPCPIAVMKSVVDKMHIREVTIAYGMTETSPVSFQSSPTDPIERRVSNRRTRPCPCRGKDHRPGRSHGAAINVRRTLHQGLLRDEGLLERRRQDGRSYRRRGRDAHRRSGHA